MLIGKLRLLVATCILVPMLTSIAQTNDLTEQTVNEIWDALRPDHDFGYDIPHDFETRAPSAAALEFVERGRSDQHRKLFKLSLPDTPLPGPKAGWLVLEEIPHSCWVSRKEIIALSLAPKNPRLIIGDYSGASPSPDNPTLTTAGFGLRIIELTPSQARRIIDFIWSLHQIKSEPISKSPHYGFSSSSADSTGYLYLSGASSNLGEHTIWKTSSVQESWRGPYNKTSCLNFAAHFFRRGVPALLKDQWQPSSLRYSSRTTPSYRTQTREQLTQSIARLLQENKNEPLPPQLLAFLVETIGECGMDSFESSLASIQQSLPPLTKLEKFLSENSLSDASDEDYHLFKKRNLTTLDLREKLDHALAQIEALSSDEKLLPFARLNYYRGDWARKRLQYSSSKIAREFHLRQFYDAPTPGFKRNAMSTLTRYSPKLTRSLIADLSDKRWKEFAPDFAHIIPTPNKKLEQTLRDIVVDTSIHERTRCSVVETLGKITPVDRDELIAFLVDLSRNFKNSSESLDKNALKIDAIKALLDLGAIPQSWDLIKQAFLQDGSWSNHYLPGLALQCLAADPTLKADVESTLMKAVTRFSYQVNETALLSLPLDLLNLADTISRHADRSLETRLAAKFHAQKTPFDRFTVLGSWAIHNHWDYDSHPTLHPLLESLARESPPEQVRTFLNRLQSQTDHDGFELILRLKSVPN